jgi:adenosine/AMP kinase
MNIRPVSIAIPEDGNVVIGQSHFIKTIEDLYEIVVGSVPSAKFGVAFNEASGPCLVRVDGNDEALQRAAVEAAQAIGAGHTFVLFLKNAFPINVLNQLKACPEVCRIFCATANPLQVLVAETEQGRGIVGVIDGSSPKGVETESDREWRRDFLRKIGYKR